MNTDVVIVGNGVAGLVLSVLLKEKGIDHVVLNRVTKRKTLLLPKTIPPSTLVLLASLNLLELFSKSSSKTFGYHSLWNSDTVTTNHFFDHNPYKYGLKLNEKELLSDLKNLVSRYLVEFNNLIEIETMRQGVVVTLQCGSDRKVISSKLIIDATGRNRSALKLLGVKSESSDDQVALSCHLPYFKHPQLIHTVYSESFEHGWGMVASLNDEVNVMTLYTDKDSSILTGLKDYKNWGELLSKTRFLKDFLAGDHDTDVIGGKANSSRATEIAGSQWLAIGDAAIAFDPLSSHGISNAIYCANVASEAIDTYLSKNIISAFQDYADTMSQVYSEYRKQKSRLYS